MEALGRAIDAGRATAAALGLRSDDVVVIHNSDRVVVRLLPCDVLVRVAPLADLSGSEFEVEVARRLAEVDAPAAELDPRVEPEVHVRDQFAISLWTYYEPVRSEIAPPLYAEALGRYHAALRQIDLAAPHFTDRVAIALAAVNDPERTPALRDTDRELLRTALSAPISGGADQLLHGEPHSGNLLNTHRGLLFVDLATCCRGPVEFDLAHAPEEVAEHYPGANHIRMRQCRTLMWAMFTVWRWRRDDQLPDGAHWRAEGLNLVRSYL